MIISERGSALHRRSIDVCLGATSASKTRLPKYVPKAYRSLCFLCGPRSCVLHSPLRHTLRRNSAARATTSVTVRWKTMNGPTSGQKAKSPKDVFECEDSGSEAQLTPTRCGQRGRSQRVTCNLSRCRILLDLRDRPWKEILLPAAYISTSCRSLGQPVRSDFLSDRFLSVTQHKNNSVFFEWFLIETIT